MFRSFLLVLVSLSLNIFSTSAQAATADAILGRMPIQSGGRIKPFDTFARETLQLIYGKAIFEGKGSSEVVLSWMLIPQEWNSRAFIQITNKDVRDAVGLTGDKGVRFSPQEIMEKGERLGPLFQSLQEKEKAREKLNVYFQAVQRLENQLTLYQAILAGAALQLVPPDASAAPSVSLTGAWLGAPDWPEEFKTKFQEVVRSFAQSVRVPLDSMSADEKNETTRARDQGLSDLERSVNEFSTLARTRNSELYPDFKKIDTEVHFNNFHPFGTSWILYLISLIALFVAVKSKNNWAVRIGWIATILAFVFHTYGFCLRVYLTGRPPVSNMYETVVWVSWGAVVFGMLFSYLKKTLFLLIASNMVAFMCMLLSDFAPSILDASLQPLQPVLRSNLWLTIHVLTITTSYAAFFVAFFMGDIGLSYYIRGEEKFKEQIRTISDGIYLTMQVGIVLLATGTILGGVWADYSWGRFWGWDPKETWALIALLGYIAVLHGRLAGWLRTFGFIVGAIVSFSLVLMAWYGVNYVLGAGLHSYGFGGGGLPYVAGFVGLHMVYVVFAMTVRSSRAKEVKAV